MKIRTVGAELLNADGQTDRQTDVHDEANSSFSQICESIKISGSVCGNKLVLFKRHVYTGVLIRPGRKQGRKHVRDARYFNKIETRAVTKFLFVHGKAPKEIHAILTETLAYFLPGRSKDLSATPVRVM